MQTITLYKYTREDGGVTVSPAKPNTDYTEMYRLVADEGKALTRDGVNLTSCTDVEDTDGWYEVDAPEEEVEGEVTEEDPDTATEEDYQNALENLGVKFDEESNVE